MIKELTEFATMVTVVIGAGAGLFEVLSQRGFRTKRHDLELMKLSLEVEKLRSELNSKKDSVHELLPADNSILTPHEPDTPNSHPELMSSFGRVIRKCLAIILSLGGLLFFFSALSAYELEKNVGLAVFLGSISGFFFALSAKGVFGVIADTRARNAQQGTPADRSASASQRLRVG